MEVWYDLDDRKVRGELVCGEHTTTLVYICCPLGAARYPLDLVGGVDGMRCAAECCRRENRRDTLGGTQYSILPSSCH